MAEDFSVILARCLDDIEQGRRTVDDCLAAYPEHREELSELLGLVTEMKALPPVLPSAAFQAAAAARLLGK